MSAFTALNIEPADHSDDEVDNTKEIQIEEALKLYQTALKLHSQGPASYHEAAKAYRTLFLSEVFRYPESATDFTRIDENPELDLQPDVTFSLEVDVFISGAGDAPSTLPQILYLSYKNYGQFVLDSLKQEIRLAKKEGKTVPDNELYDRGMHALESFAKALARDESDTELWRRTARLAKLLGSKSITRYCLEAAVEADDDPTVAEVEPPALEEGFSGEQLKGHLELLEDKVALSHPIMGPYVKKAIPSLLRKYMDPYPFLDDLPPPPLQAMLEKTEEARADIKVLQATWAAIGDVIWRAYAPEEVFGNKTLRFQFPDEDQVMIEANKTHATSNSKQTTDAELAASTATPAESDQGKSGTGNDADEDMADATVTPTNEVPSDEQGVTLPNRKRSQSAAGIPTQQEEETTAQKRSKRIRNRDTLTTEVLDAAAQLAAQLRPCVEADEQLFQYVGTLLDKLDVHDLGPYKDLQSALDGNPSSDRAEMLKHTAVRDLKALLGVWDDSKYTAFFNGDTADSLCGGANGGIAAFLEHSKGPGTIALKPVLSATEGLPAFISRVENEHWTLPTVAYQWLLALHKSYRSARWSDELKITIVRVLNWVDAPIMEHLQAEIELLTSSHRQSEEYAAVEAMIQMIFEIHLDIYTKITNPMSVVAQTVRLAEKERCNRWAVFAADMIHSRHCDQKDELTLRYLWASAYFASLSDNVSPEHVILCWTDIQALFEEVDVGRIDLPNNAVMPEISAAAAEREVSRLTTGDFFENLFAPGNPDVISVIETLEPVLDPSSTRPVSDAETGEETNVDGMVLPKRKAMSDEMPAAVRDLSKLLTSNNPTLRLLLWQRLQDAYDSIKYKTKVFSCQLRSIEVIVNELHSDSYVDTPPEARHLTLLSWLKSLDDLLVKALVLALNLDTAFEIIDEDHLKSTLSALAKLCKILHGALLLEDEIRVGATTLPRTRVYGNQGTFQAFQIKLREMVIRVWALQYTVLREAMKQRAELFPTEECDLADYMALVHLSLGLRKLCKSSNKIFLKMMKVELIRFKHIERWEDYLGQVLYDLHGLRLGAGTYLLAEHECPNDPLDQKSAISLVPLVIELSNRLPMKDLLRSELRPTIERIQQAIGQTKNNPRMQHNFRNQNEFLKQSIHPLRLYKALKGLVEIDSLPVRSPEASLAAAGWYFLLGNMALAKYKAQKRSGPGATDDLKVAATFLRLQLQFTSDHWETWYRWAQSFDSDLEEDIQWTADKINNARSELVVKQRHAIHCYTMALSTALRTADPNSFETASKLSELYFDFGMRIYASSREPFSMEVFDLSDYERYYSGREGMYKKHAHQRFNHYRAWNYASILFRRALEERPKHWLIHYMLGKCYWKMYSRHNPDKDPERIPWTTVVDTFSRAIENVPRSRDHSKPPILEPHYKLMSVVHKMVLRGHIEPQVGADILQSKPYAVRKGEELAVENQEEWEAYFLDCIRVIRGADKANWHHRMIFRVARILWDDEQQPPDMIQASAARHELKESMFTKTMVVNVWKPEFERSGRHCVYTSRYVIYMIRLLWMLGDKVNMEMLAKRVRKKQGDYINFDAVWNECCTKYYRLIRKSFSIPPDQDDRFKQISHERFAGVSARLADWIALPDSAHPALECLREAVELKKLNANLMKTTPLDDLINDAYAVLFFAVGTDLPGEDPEPASEAALQVPPAVRAPGPMSLNNLVMNMDGVIDQQAAMFVSAMPIQTTDSVPRPRKVGTSRREILRTAEAALTRVPEPAKTTVRGRMSEGLQTNGNGRHPSATVEARQAQKDKDDSSVPGSVHDSADDESDLSDVPDMDDPGMMFPNLARARSENARGSSAVNTPTNGDDEGEGQGDGEEEEGDDEGDEEDDAGEGEGEGDAEDEGDEDA